MQLLGYDAGSSATASRRSTSSIRGVRNSLNEPFLGSRPRSSREVEMRDVMETVRKQHSTAVGGCSSMGEKNQPVENTIIKDAPDGDTGDLKGSSEGAKHRNATLTGSDMDGLTEFERAVLSKYIRELQEAEGSSDTKHEQYSASDQGDDSVRDNRLSKGGAQHLDENANPLVADSDTQSQQQMDVPCTVAGFSAPTPQVVTFADGSSTLTSTGTDNSGTIFTTTTTTITANSSNSNATNHNSSNDLIQRLSEGDNDSTVAASRSLSSDANANVHNHVAPAESHCCTITTTTTNAAVLLPMSAGDAAAHPSNSTASSSSTSTLTPTTATETETAAAGTGGGSNTTMARAAMAAIRDRAMRRNFSVWVGVTSCVWGLLLYLIKTYT